MDPHVCRPESKAENRETQIIMPAQLPISFCFNPHYVAEVCRRYVNDLRWSRKRRKKWLRRHGYTLHARTKDMLEYAALELDAGQCWCGEKDAYFAPVHGSCGGSGELECHCGGDLCVCHNHGGAACHGCPDCQDEFLDYDSDY